MIRDALEDGFRRTTDIAMQYVCRNLHDSRMLTCIKPKSRILQVFDR